MGMETRSSTDACNVNLVVQLVLQLQADLKRHNIYYQMYYKSMYNNMYTCIKILFVQSLLMFTFNAIEVGTL